MCVAYFLTYWGNIWAWKNRTSASFFCWLYLPLNFLAASNFNILFWGCLRTDPFDPGEVRSFLDQSLMERHCLNFFFIPYFVAAAAWYLIISRSRPILQFLPLPFLNSWIVNLLRPWPQQLWRMKVLVVLLLASPFIPTTETRRRRSSSYVPGAMSHLSRHFFSRIRARSQHQDPQTPFGTQQKKKHVPYHQFDHKEQVHRKQDQEFQHKQIYWNRSNRKIEDSQRDQTQRLFSKIKKDLLQTIKTLVRW